MRLAVERVVVGVSVVGFVIGTSTHLLQLVNRGWVVFAAAPTWMNVYWTSLTFLDPLAAMLLLRARRAGLILAVAIMLSDVAVNSHALYGLNLPFAIWALQLQTLFCGFLLGAIGFLWGANDESARSST
jgi:peptidoglycan/LPS O-acetylase OafA/YrhL